MGGTADTADQDTDRHGATRGDMDRHAATRGAKCPCFK